MLIPVGRGLDILVPSEPISLLDGYLIRKKCLSKKPAFFPFPPPPPQVSLCSSSWPQAHRTPLALFLGIMTCTTMPIQPSNFLEHIAALPACEVNFTLTPSLKHAPESKRVRGYRQERACVASFGSVYNNHVPEAGWLSLAMPSVPAGCVNDTNLLVAHRQFSSCAFSCPLPSG